MGPDPNFLRRAFAIAGHKNAIVELHFTSDGERIVTASPDKSVRAWDVATGQQVRFRPMMDLTGRTLRTGQTMRRKLVILQQSATPH